MSSRSGDDPLLDFSQLVNSQGERAETSVNLDSGPALPLHSDGETPAPVTYADIGGSDTASAELSGWYDWDMGVRKALADWFVV